MQYSIDSVRAGYLVKKLEIIHPYGAVGDLPMSVQGGVHFGGNPDKLDEDYARLSERIRTYTEQIADDVQLQAVRSQFERAANIVFLGFAFHDQNIALLKPAGLIKRSNLYGTAFGMSESDVVVVLDQLKRFYEDAARMTFDDHAHIKAALQCNALFDFYGKSLPA